MAAASVFQRLRSGSRLGPQYDQEGNVIEVETREDEEQNVKLAEILELLVAAGYFRARIKGLSPFDKVVGGMTWCITTCSFDIDVDLLFQENSTIGQKIALTEKIVSVLPNMKCPHRLEPHQIQGLDFIHIFPVVQWLVKRAIETREEMGDYIRSFSVSQFQKNHSLLEDNDFKQRKSKAMKAVVDVSDVYKPQRKYKRLSGAQTLIDEESRVHSTLLEFGRLPDSLMRYGFSRPKTEKAEDKKVTLAAGMTEVSEEEDLQAAEELRIKTLMTGMAAMATEEGRLTASTVGQIVGLQSEEIKQIASEYAGKQNELSTEDHPERFGVAQQHRRQVASLSKQILQKSKQLEELQVRRDEIQTRYGEAKKKLLEIVRHGEKLDKELSALEVAESQADSGLLEKLRALVTMNEDLKSQEQEFRTHCREEMARLQQQIESLKAETGNDESAEKEHKELIEQQYKGDQEKLQKIRLLLARRNREIAILQRKIDEVPSRVELTQYQRRFVELYSQVAATHKETKQFFTLYNTLDDKKVYLEKEVSLLNSIHDNFQLAMASPAAREQFLRQMEQIVEGIKQNRMKLEKKKQENKMRRDQLNDEYLELLEKQRLYFKTVKEFKEECRKNEILLTKLRTKGIS
ncbi:coiled-coil domain-containing protein 93 isoform X1 [Callorhinchus milii]|uniref:Coiled-coil domain-containing protein 93 n=1 Tax=Callorhinchus milii TaxID=7868 RepID=V9KIX7_CALMI|nr:coiled-coil domain-containing protein 93 isoform X1 [Callorhinchus milii]|eukprot:gi/632957228/ref/XP_007894365.1/ PREDICTED: coiled-coil domain-containing protein 93 isoform X1 [Callorhinchus milii]